MASEKIKQWWKKCNPKEPQEYEIKRRLRFLERRLNGIKENQDQTDYSIPSSPLILGKKPSAIKVLSEFKSQEKYAVQDKEGTDVGDHRTFGMGVVGQVSQRELNPEVSNSPHIREQLENLADYRPYFSYWISAVQIVISILALSVYGLGPIGFGLTHTSGLVLTEWLTLEQVDVFQPSNVWIGPSYNNLVRLGATFTPCMKRDQGIAERLEFEDSTEGNLTGCCVRNDRSGCVQTRREHCSPVLSTFHKWSERSPGPEGRTSGPVCGLDPHYCDNPASNGPFAWPDDITKWPVCRQSSSRYQGRPRHMDCDLVARPCCVGIHGQCQLRSREYCDWVQGVFHPEASLCTQVNCMQDICGMLPFVDAEKPDQIYRLITSLFLNAGLIHTVISVSFQLVIMRDVEKMCGPLRMSLIYFSSGIMGNLLSATFTPYRPESGPSGALFGVMATLIVEIIRAWPILKKPYLALSQIGLVVLGFFVIGMLPWVDNYAHIGGFVTGFVMSYALIPKIQIERQEVMPWLTYVAIASVAISFVILLLIFYFISFKDCSWCSWLSCVPFTRDFCSEMNINYERKQRLF